MLSSFILGAGFADDPEFPELPDIPEVPAEAAFGATGDAAVLAWATCGATFLG